MARMKMGLGIAFGDYPTYGVLIVKCGVTVRDIYFAVCISFGLCMLWNDKQVFIIGNIGNC